MATASSYYQFRQWINCQKGGYVEEYNLNTALGTPGTTPPTPVLNAVKSITCLRGQLLEGNSKIANGEISIETVPGMNPPEGFQVPHNVPNSSPIVFKDPTTGTLENIPDITKDASQAIAFRLDTQAFFSDLRTLRSLRSSWVQQWSVLYPNILTQLGVWGANPPARGTLITSFPGGSTDPAVCIAYFMLVAMVNSNLVQPLKSGGVVYTFNILPYAQPNSSGSPAVVNPILQTQLTVRKIGEGWPKIAGRAQNFASSK